MAQLTLLRKSTIYDNDLQSYRMTLEITGSEDITKYVFVNQRLRNLVNRDFDDVFAAVATPTQLEDFAEDAPTENSSYFRATHIDLISRNADYLEEVFQAILGELQKLVEDVESLNALIPDGVYTISADHIDVNMAILHTHYRLPLTAAPAGNNEVFTDTGVQKQRVASQDTNKAGWLNDTSVSGYNFKYNIPKDTTLNGLWPIDTDKLPYAHLEVNGISRSASDVLINEDGIFWKSNLLGYAPFAEDYVNSGDPGTEVPVLVLDIIV